MTNKKDVWLETICAKALDGTCPTLNEDVLEGPRDEDLFGHICSIEPGAYTNPQCPNKYHFEFHGR